MELEKIKQLIMEYPDGDISEMERSLVEKFLEDSTEYELLYSASRRLDGLMDKWTEIEPSTDYVSTFWRRMEAEEEEEAGLNLKEFWSGLKESILGFRLSFGVAAVVTSVLILGVLIGARNMGFLNESIVGTRIAAVLNSPRSDTTEKSDSTENKLLEEVDSTISAEPAQGLEIYGPWDEYSNETGGIRQGEGSFNTLIRTADYGNIY